MGQEMESETAHKAKLQDVLQTSILLRDSVCSVRHEQKLSATGGNHITEFRTRAISSRLEITLLTIQHIMKQLGQRK